MVDQGATRLVIAELKQAYPEIPIIAISGLLNSG